MNLPAIILVYLTVILVLVIGRVPRVAIAFMVSPILPGIVAGIKENSVMTFLLGGFFTYIFSIPAIPVYFLYKKLGWLAYWKILVTSSLLGALWSFGLNGLAFEGGIKLLNAGTVIQCVVYADLVGSMFWLIGIARFSYVNYAIVKIRNRVRSNLQRPNKSLKDAP